MKLKVQYLENYQPNWEPLHYAKAGDSGMDLRAAIENTIVLLFTGGNKSLNHCQILIHIILQKVVYYYHTNLVQLLIGVYQQ